MKFLAILLVLALATTAAIAYDPSPLQDICVGTNRTRERIYVNGKFCKNENLVTVEDFVFEGFRKRGNTSNWLRSRVTPAFVDEFPRINTLGVSMARHEFGPRGLIPPHIHPRASEILLVVRGTLYVGFVTGDQFGNRLFATVLRRGDIFVFPIGLIHFQLNVGKTRALAFAGLNSQNPGVVTMANALFGPRPLISSKVLTKAFRLDRRVIEYLESQNWRYNETYYDAWEEPLE